MIDFTKIIAGVAGQRETFEELVCQIARRAPPPGASEYRRIHGAGGDGGVEAVWLLDDGTEHGYQAKYYTSSAGVDWGAIDDSVATAMSTHPKLDTMYIAIACALTGQTNRRTRSGAPQVTGWDQWAAHKAKWEAAATAIGRKINFTPWTAPDIEEMLTRPAMVGLFDYWFGGIELSTDRLSSWCRRTIDALDERYHPEDHVEVATRRAFDGLVRHGDFWKSLSDARETVFQESRIGAGPDLMPDADKALVQLVRTEAAALLTDLDGVRIPNDAAMPYDRWAPLAQAARKAAFAAERAARDHLETAKALPKREEEGAAGASGSSESSQTDSLIYTLRKAQDAAGAILDLIDSAAARSDGTRLLYLDGRAGSGKSHLMASEIERLLAAGGAALFLLGTDFQQQEPIERQILARLGLDPSQFEQLLGALNARAEASGMRGLIAIDALNEGAGAALWRPGLFPFVKRVLEQPNLALCISCRQEYAPFLIVDGVTAMATKVEVRGFETADELEAAARVYMDRRGIARPGVPWLNPEFSNPLFLRTTCLALARDGRTQFPRGMRGTSEVLTFYLNSTARHLGTSYDGSNMLEGPLTRALLSLASDMASGLRDFVERDKAHELVDTAFVGFSPTSGKTWLEHLRFAGVVRFDPHPDAHHDDPLEKHDDVVRFSFQRFQDHLIARALTEGVASPDGLFNAGGKLAFILEEYGIHWQWRGLFAALYVHCADRFGIELPDIMPGGAERWWREWDVQDAFIESVRWRSVKAFTDRSRELLNQIGQERDQLISLIVELAVVVDHPWNARLLQRNLIGRTLPERDSFWTQPINEAHLDRTHSVSRLIDWGLNLNFAYAEDDTLALALTTLGWICSSTSAIVRDSATKAMVRILIHRPHLAEGLFDDLAESDDPYVVERLYGAVYGAALRTRAPASLAIFARLVWRHCFQEGEPPVHILTRDYARGTVELAAAAGSLDSDIDIEQCRPPYGSAAPVFNITEKRVEARAAKVGAESILYSCYKGLADFGRYTLEHPVEQFAAARLSGPRPETSAESGERFVNEVCSGRDDVLRAIEKLREAYEQQRVTFDMETMTVKIPASDRRRITRAEKALMSLLTPAEQKRFRREAAPWVDGSKRYDWSLPGKAKGQPVNAHRAKLWVANRAIGLGWTKTIFPHDPSGENRSNRPRVERIGKKYQWIALHELMARLADNYWLKPDWGSIAKRYDNPTEVGFHRDIDPSILPEDLAARQAPELPVVPRLQCEPLQPEHRHAWVHAPNLATARLQLGIGSDVDPAGWATLYRYGSHDIDVERRSSLVDTPWHQSDFHFISTLLLPKDDASRFVAEVEAHRDDVHDWLPRSIVDGPYLGELGRRDTWDSDPWTDLEARGAEPRTYRAIRPTITYQWESHLDGSLRDGVSRQVPIPWIIEALDLRQDPDHLGTFVDGDGRIVIVAVGGRQHIVTLIRREALDRLASAHDLQPIWTVIGERMALPKFGNRLTTTRVRYNGVLWFGGPRAEVRSWSRPD